MGFTSGSAVIAGVLEREAPAIVFKTTAQGSINFDITLGDGANSKMIWDDGTTEIHGNSPTFSWGDASEKTVQVWAFDEIGIDTTFTGKDLTYIMFWPKRVKAKWDSTLNLNDNNITNFDQDILIYVDAWGGNSNGGGWFNLYLDNNPNLVLSEAIVPDQEQCQLRVRDCNLTSSVNNLELLGNRSYDYLLMGDNALTTFPDTPKASNISIVGNAGTTTFEVPNFSASYVNSAWNPNDIQSWNRWLAYSLHRFSVGTIGGGGNGWTIAQLNEFLVNLDTVATDLAGTGITKFVDFRDQDIDDTSGGFDGSAAWASLQAKGWAK